ncbi:MAG: hypothetical protein ACREAU_03020 [Nitrosopumilaceae archaeon]
MKVETILDYDDTGLSLPIMVQILENFTDGENIEYYVVEVAPLFVRGYHIDPLYVFSEENMYVFAEVSSFLHKNKEYLESAWKFKEKDYSYKIGIKKK